MDRRHTADNVAKRASLKDKWLKLSHVLANMRNRRGKLMPGWITLQQKPIHTIKSQLVQWRKLRLVVNEALRATSRARPPE